MNSGLTTSQRDRSERIDRVSSQLLPRVAVLTRLLTRQLGCELSRTELGLLNTLSSAPKRITELAELERLAQPTLTQLVQRLERQGFVNRERQADDGRVVLVSLTDAGAAALDDFRCRASAALGARLAELPDAEVESLAAATETIGRLVTLLQQGRGADTRRATPARLEVALSWLRVGTPGPGGPRARAHWDQWTAACIVAGD